MAEPTPSSAPLLPCPFCGAIASAIEHKHADDCYFTLHKQLNHEAKQETADLSLIPAVLQAWNTRAPEAVAAQAPAAAAWENFPCYLIDHCEGDVITEEGLQRALAAMLANPKYAATPALPATEDSSAGDLVEEMPWDGKLSDQLQRAINDLHTECKPAVVRHLDFEIRREITALHTSLATVKRMYAAARDRLEAIDAAQPDPFATQAEVQAEPVAHPIWAVFRTRPEENGGKEFLHYAMWHNDTRLNEGERYVQGYFVTAPQAQPADALTQAARDVLTERHRQVSAEGWTLERDDQYVYGDLATAAGCYAMYTQSYPKGDPHHSWPWDKGWWKPSADPRRNRVKACALLLAEIERLDRAAQAAAQEGGDAAKAKRN